MRRPPVARFRPGGHRPARHGVVYLLGTAFFGGVTDVLGYLALQDLRKDLARDGGRTVTGAADA
jgi:hypothetical protein